MARSTSKNRMVATMSKLLHVSRRTLHKYTKFRVKIDENDEVACWALVCRVQHIKTGWKHIKTGWDLVVNPLIKNAT